MDKPHTQKMLIRMDSVSNAEGFDSSRFMSKRGGNSYRNKPEGNGLINNLKSTS
jgi:hypothetical protein